MSIFKWLRRHLRRLGSLPSEIESKLWRKKMEKRIRTENDRRRVIRPLKNSNKPVIIAALILLLLGLFIAFGGSLVTGTFPDSIISEFYANVSTELVSIAITVLIIDFINSWRQDKLEKERILRQLSSRSNDFALDAVRIARDYGWLDDGSLFNYQLDYGNLQNAPLDHAYLRSAGLFGANLKDAHLFQAYLKRAFMEGANLSGADLSGSNLKDAVLIGANLKNANLWLANLENASLAGANLEGALVLQANLKGVNLGGANFKNVIYDQYTLWPEGYDLLNSGATLLENVNFGDNPVTRQSYGYSIVGQDAVEGSNKRPWENEEELF